jgi:SAM-dependent methyltransferase
MNTAARSFGLSADFYEKFRPSYPQSLATAILSSVPPHGRTRAVDLGAGAGHSLPFLLDHFGQVIAVEPDSQMASKISPADNLAIRIATAEKVTIDSASVDLVSCGTAFYWMDGPAVLQRAREWLVPGGGVAIYRYSLPRFGVRADTVIDHHMASYWDAHRHERLRDEEYSWRTLSTAPGYVEAKRLSLPNVHRLELEQVVGFFCSTSYVSTYLRTLASPDEYLESLADDLRGTADQGAPFAADFGVELLLANAD